MRQLRATRDFRDGADFYLAETEWRLGEGKKKQDGQDSGDGQDGTCCYPNEGAAPLLSARPVRGRSPGPRSLGAALEALLRSSSENVEFFVRHVSRLQLRRYQQQVAQAVVNSVVKQRGMSFVVLFPRQSGKNELQAQIETYLLLRLSQCGGEMVKVSPTWKPQSLNAMRRLERVLSANLLTQALWRKELGYIYRLGQARIYFLSGQATSHVVGATASALLECDEAQDVSIAKWDKEIAPMAASTNATRVFWGTAWSSQTLLARELRAAREAERRDGQRRVWVLTADEVGAEVPAYKKFVEEQVSRLGRNHPLIRTQYFSEEIDAQAGLFPPARRALMQGGHAALAAPRPGYAYAMTVDVAGEDEGVSDAGASYAGAGDLAAEAGGESGRYGLRSPSRDSTAVTVFEVDLATLADEMIKAPTYRVVQRVEWVGTRHSALYGQLKALAEHWAVQYLVIDATGVGQGLYSFLDKALPGAGGRPRGTPRVIPYLFTGKSKSDLGWQFLAVIETGRYKEYYAEHDRSAAFWRQVEYAQSEVLGGPQRLLRWGVPDGTRDSITGSLVHDDLLISAALCAVLDEQKWGLAESAVAPVRNLFAEMQEVY